MADLEAYKDRFSESGQRVFQNAVNESRRRDQNYISVEHIISALSKEEPDLFNSTMRSLASGSSRWSPGHRARLDTARAACRQRIRIAPDVPIFSSARPIARSPRAKEHRGHRHFRRVSN
jgi:ATP-dependent Clp protease ATP-binding subunit ClpA